MEHCNFPFDVCRPSDAYCKIDRGDTLMRARINRDLCPAQLASVLNTLCRSRGIPSHKTAIAVLEKSR